MSYNQYKGVIHKHLVKDDPCWENYEMVGTKIQDGKEVPNCVPKQQKDDEPVEKNFNKYLEFEMKQLITLIKRKDDRAEKKALYILKQIKNLVEKRNHETDYREFGPIDRKSIQLVAHLTDINYHTEARMELAGAIGANQLVNAYRNIQREQDRLGHLPQRLSNKRRQLDRTLERMVLRFKNGREAMRAL